MPTWPLIIIFILATGKNWKSPLLCKEMLPSVLKVLTKVVLNTLVCRSKLYRSEGKLIGVRKFDCLPNRREINFHNVTLKR